MQYRWHLANYPSPLLFNVVYEWPQSGVTGKYYADCKEAKLLHPMAENEVLAKKLWEISAELVQI